MAGSGVGAVPPAALDPLLAEHAIAIAQLRAELGTSLPAEWDDIWILRFVLSNETFASRVANARETISWRAANAPMLADAAAGRPLARIAHIEKFQVIGIHGQSNYGEPLYIVRAGLSNPPAMMDGEQQEGDILSWVRVIPCRSK